MCAKLLSEANVCMNLDQKTGKQKLVLMLICQEMTKKLLETNLDLYQSRFTPFQDLVRTIKLFLKVHFELTNVFKTLKLLYVWIACHNFLAKSNFVKVLSMYLSHL